MSSAPITDYDLATALVKRHPRALLALEAFREYTGVSLKEATTIVADAFNREYGKYYLVVPGSGNFDGPFVGITAAREASSHAQGTAVLVVPAWSASIMDVAVGLVKALPDLGDHVTVLRLLSIFDAARDRYEPGGQPSLAPFIQEARKRLGNQP